MYCCAKRPATYVCGDDIHLCYICHDDKAIKQVCEARTGMKYDQYHNSMHHVLITSLCYSFYRPPTMVGNCVFEGKHPRDFPVGKAHKKYSTGCIGCR